MYTVYMHECPNGKRYVGITSRSCKKRWNCGYGYFNNPAFDEDIKKYGWENVKHFVLKQCEDADEGYEAEKYYIKLYDTTNTEKGYNHSTGGKNSSEGFRHTEDAKEKIAEASRGRKRSKESIEKVAKESNILDTRLKGVGTSIYAFAQTTGLESADALGLRE